jgi:hypothetical protein
MPFAFYRFWQPPVAEKLRFLFLFHFKTHFQSIVDSKHLDNTLKTLIIHAHNKPKKSNSTRSQNYSHDQI